MDLSGKVALIAGGARMGPALAEALAQRGCAVALTYHTSPRAVEQAVEGASALGVRAVALRADLRRAVAAQAVVRAVCRRLGRLDVLVALASIYERTPWATLTRTAWERGLVVDLHATLWLARAAAGAMRRQGGGRIVTCADWVAASGRPRYRGFVPYYTAKAAVLGLTEALALELAPSILVNAIAPGPILPPRGVRVAEERAVRAATPLGRWGGPEEVARAVVFLAETDFVTGECLRVDGGRHLV